MFLIFPFCFIIFSKEPNRSGWAKHLSWCLSFPMMLCERWKYSACYERELLFGTYSTLWPTGMHPKDVPRCFFFKKFTSSLHSSQVVSVICGGEETTRIIRMSDNWKSESWESSCLNPSILLVRWSVQFRCQYLPFCFEECVCLKIKSVTRDSRWKSN